MVKLRNALLVLLLACGSAVHAQSWRDHFDVTASEFRAGISLLGKPREESLPGEAGMGPDRYTVIMAGTVLKSTGEVAPTILAVQTRYFSRGWRGWSRAATSQAEVLETSSDRGDVAHCSRDGCFRTEMIHVTLPMATLRQAAKEPLRIRLSARAPGVEFIVHLDPREAQALVDGLEEVSASAKAPR